MYKRDDHHAPPVGYIDYLCACTTMLFSSSSSFILFIYFHFRCPVFYSLSVEMTDKGARRPINTIFRAGNSQRHTYIPEKHVIAKEAEMEEKGAAAGAALVALYEAAEKESKRSE